MRGVVEEQKQNHHFENNNYGNYNFNVLTFINESEKFHEVNFREWAHTKYLAVQNFAKMATICDIRESLFSVPIWLN